MSTGQTGSVAWVVITSDDLYARMNGPQTDAIRNAALAQGQDADTVFDDIMADVARRIRQYIASNPKNTLSATESAVPPELKWMLVWLVLQELMARLAIALELREDQKTMLKQAEEDLDKLRNWHNTGNWLVISRPDDPETNPELTAGTNAYVVSDSCRKFTRNTLKAL